MMKLEKISWGTQSSQGKSPIIEFGWLMMNNGKIIQKMTSLIVICAPVIQISIFERNIKSPFQFPLSSSHFCLINYQHWRFIFKAGIMTSKSFFSFYARRGEERKLERKISGKLNLLSFKLVRHRWVFKIGYFKERVLLDFIFWFSDLDNR